MATKTSSPSESGRMNRNAAKASFLERVQKILDRTACW
jgi:hypothetical protein